MIIFSEVVKVIDIEVFQFGEGDAFRFRLEVSRELNSSFYIAKVYRLETYRLQPTFPQSNGDLPDLKNDALIYIADEMFDPEKLRGTSVEEVTHNFEKEFNGFFGKIEK
jgi:hypothetical protein